MNAIDQAQANAATAALSARANLGHVIIIGGGIGELVPFGS